MIHEFAHLTQADIAAYRGRELVQRATLTLADALAEASLPLTKQQQRVKKRVEAKGMVYAVNGDGVGCVFKR